MLMESLPKLTSVLTQYSGRSGLSRATLCPSCLPSPAGSLLQPAWLGALRAGFPGLWPATRGVGRGQHVTRAPTRLGGWPRLVSPRRAAGSPSTKSTRSCAPKPKPLVVGKGDLPWAAGRGRRIQKETRAILRGWEGEGGGCRGRSPARFLFLQASQASPRPAPPARPAPSPPQPIGRGDPPASAPAPRSPRLSTLKVYSGPDAGVASHVCLRRDAARREAVRPEPGGAGGPGRPLPGLAGSGVVGRPSPQVRGLGGEGRAPSPGGDLAGPAEPLWGPIALGLGGLRLPHLRAAHAGE